MRRETELPRKLTPQPSKQSATKKAPGKPGAFLFLYGWPVGWRAVDLRPAPPEPALAELRRVQRKKRLAGLDWIDALYHAYLAAIIAVVVVLWSSGLVEDSEIGADGVAKVIEHGPAYVGCLFALFVFLGLSSGANGGPLALENAEVTHVLLAPVDRGAALVPAVIRRIRTVCFAGAVVGAAVGQLAFRRLPGEPAAWIACGVAVGVLGGASYVGCAVIGSGRRLKTWAAPFIALPLVALSVGDIVLETRISPFTYAGQTAVWPLEFDPMSLFGVMLILVLPIVGVYACAGTSLEAARRRAGLQAQLRFAATLYDVRTVIILRRLLSQERSRTEPWIGLPRSTRTRLPVWRRSWQGVLRWPGKRLLRLPALAIVAGIALVGVWNGVTPLVVVAGGALYLAALDAVEPLAQEVDHPQLSESLPVSRGALNLRHLPTPIAVMAVAGIVAVLALLPFERSMLFLEIASVTVPIAALAAVCGAALSTVGDPPTMTAAQSVATPELLGVTVVVLAVWPPIVAILGVLPVAAGASQIDEGTDAVLIAARSTAFIVLMLCLFLVLWIEKRDSILERFRAGMGTS